MTPESIYERREQAYRRLHERQRQTAIRLSNLRLATVAAGLVAGVFLYRAVGTLAGLAVGGLTLVLFAYFALRHMRVQRQLGYSAVLRELNHKGLERAAGRWTSFPDTGAEFKDDEHPFASDLDLFGQASFFQWLNSTHTELGRQALARLLQRPAQDCAEIRARQEAAAELARALPWRQRFEAEGQLAAGKLAPTEPLLQWARASHPSYLTPAVKLGVWLLPAITISLLVAYLAAGAVPWQAPAAFAVIQLLLLRVGGNERGGVLTMVYRQEAQLKSYSAMLEHLERKRFASTWLRERQASLRNGAGQPAYEQIRHLSQIAERIANRENAIFIFVNILILWDYHCMIALERWKRDSGPLLGAWLEVLAEVEALASLAHIGFEHPDWTRPTVVEALAPGGEHGLAATGMGHPLITRNRVDNDFELTLPTQVTVITGSNMSGKSTFLRTVGANLVLAYAGAPVCAAAFSCSRMSLWTCMRVADNLEQSISSFYAEILRIKRIVEAAKKGRVFFLLDEIFKGTNSLDRHQGAKALIAHLQRDGALGLISTHDLELGDLERGSGVRIRNFHFREYYEGQQLRFDYKLRRGVSTTRNALYLIKLAGIELEEGG